MQEKLAPPLAEQEAGQEEKKVATFDVKSGSDVFRFGFDEEVPGSFPSDNGSPLA
ncbi:MAG: hypothetical protein AB1730_17055 [Myxococcota bacterium]